MGDRAADKEARFAVIAASPMLLSLVDEETRAQYVTSLVKAQNFKGPEEVANSGVVATSEIFRIASARPRFVILSIQVRISKRHEDVCKFVDFAFTFEEGIAKLKALYDAFHDELDEQASKGGGGPSPRNHDLADLCHCPDYSFFACSCYSPCVLVETK